MTQIIKSLCPDLLPSLESRGWQEVGPTDPVEEGDAEDRRADSRRTGARGARAQAPTASEAKAASRPFERTGAPLSGGLIP